MVIDIRKHGRDRSVALWNGFYVTFGFFNEDETVFTSHLKETENTMNRRDESRFIPEIRRQSGEFMKRIEATGVLLIDWNSTSASIG